jgi:hypothetical protein
LEVGEVGVKNPRSYVANCGRAADAQKRDLERGGVNVVCVNAVEVYMIKEIFVVGG